MKNISRRNEPFALPAHANYIQQGEGAPVILIHGLAASLHDWDDLVPALAANGFSAYALDLLGHGYSEKPCSRSYHIDWLFEHFAAWVDTLALNQPAIIIGHSLGGYLALEMARRRPAQVHALVLVNPFYSLAQLPPFLQLTYRWPEINMSVMERAPGWLLRFIIDMSSLSIGHSNGGLHNLPERVRAQTTQDYRLTAPGVYHVPASMRGIQDWVSEVTQPCLLLWGSRDLALRPDSFDELAGLMSQARTHILHSGHVPHQSHVNEFNEVVMEFLKNVQTMRVEPG